MLYAFNPCHPRARFTGQVGYFDQQDPRQGRKVWRRQAFRVLATLTLDTALGRYARHGQREPSGWIPGRQRRLRRIITTGHRVERAQDRIKTTAEAGQEAKAGHDPWINEDSKNDYRESKGDFDYGLNKHQGNGFMELLLHCTMGLFDSVPSKQACFRAT